MKKTLQSYQTLNLRFLLLPLLFFCNFFSTQGQTTLAVGDISILGVNSNAPDNFTFVCWVDIANNTKIKFTDNGFLSSNLSTATGNGRGGENFVTWTNNTGNIISAGTVIKIENGTGNVVSASIGTAVQTLSGISNGGDQIFAYQGTGAGTSTSTSDFGTNVNPSTFTGTILFGLNFPSSWLTTGSPTSNTSYLPSELNISNGNLFLAASSTGGQYTGSRNNQSSIIAYRSMVNNSLNWTITTGSSVTTLNTTSFTIAATPTISTSGTLLSVNTTYGTVINTPTSFSVSGSSLTNDILITPPSGFEVSQTSGGLSGYADSQTLTQTAGVVNATTIYVRLKATASVSGSPYSGNIVLSSVGVTSVNVPTVSSTVAPKNLTITGLTANNKTYDRDNAAALSGMASYAGLENGETFVVTGTPIATFSDALKGDGKTVTVMGYTAPSTNYTVTQPTGLTANITAKALTVSSAFAANKIYDGNTNATINGAMLDGVISPDEVTLSGNGSFDNPLVADAIPITTALVLGGADATNYSIVQPSGLTADITHKPLTISGLSANNKVFDGNTNASLTGTAVLNGVVSGDEAEVLLGGSPTATFASSAVGTGIAVTVTGYLLTGSKVGNYSLTQPSGLTADITNLPTPVINSTLTATAVYGMVAPTYTITASNSPTSFNAIGLPDGLAINTSTGEITGTPTNPAGSPFNVTISASNEGGTGNATLVYTINKKTLTLNSASAQNKVYDRTDVATISGTLAGIVGVDEVSFIGTGTFAQHTFGNGITVTSTASLGGADAAKYTLTQPTGLTANITKKSLTVSGASAANKIYDGNTSASISGATMVGVINPDVLNISGNGTFTSPDVADNILINTSLELSGADAGNYELIQPSGITANITSASLTLSGFSASNKEYDGTTSSTLLGTPALNGVINSDDVSITGTGTAAFTNKNTGTSKPILLTGFSLSGAKASNYILVVPTNLTADITPKVLTLTGAAAQNKNFDGNTNAVITGTLNGVISPDVVTFTGTGTFASSAVGNGIAVTTAITLGGADASNYTITQPTGLSANIIAPQFTAGNLAVFVAAAFTNNTTGSIVELNTSSAGQSGVVFPIPSTGTDLLRFSGSATSTGYLSNSNDGGKLLFTGFNNSNTAVNANTLNPRGVGSFGPDGGYNLVTTYTGNSGNQTRSATTLDNSTYFIADQGGIYTNGSTSASPVGNFRGIKSFGGTVYVSQSSSNANLIQVGTLAAATGSTILGLPGLTNNANLQDYYLISSSTNGLVYDILYVLSGSSATVGTISKYSLVSSTWVANGSYTTNFGGFGLAAKKSVSGADLFVSTGNGATTANNVIKLVDESGHNTNISINTSNNLVLYTAAAGSIVKGVAFSPVAPPPTVNLSVSTNSGSESGASVITVTATSTSAVSGNQTVDLAVTGVNVTVGDYVLSNTTITIPDGQTTGSVTFTVMDDAILEALETATLTISNPSSGLTLGPVLSQNISIIDNDNSAPTILLDVSATTNYLDGSATSNISSPYAISGVINDANDPALILGLDFILNDAETLAGDLQVTVVSSNQSVVPNANLNLTGSGANRNLKITPIAAGYAMLTLTVSDGISSLNFTVNYAASLGLNSTPNTRFHTGKSDASTAIKVDNDHMLVADDEDQTIRLYNRNNSGLPINSFDFTSSLGLTDPNATNPREVDLESSLRIGTDIYWMGSESNSSGGSNRPNRNRVFKTALSGTGASTTLTYVSRYDFLKDDILAWDANNVHGKGADYYGLVASAAPGVIPESSTLNGFNIEGIEMAPDNTTAYIAFRAPQVIPTDRKNALIIPVSNFTTILTPTGGTAGSATFGTPIEINLGGRGIREIRKNAANEYVLIAGPADAATGVAPKDFKFFTWTGKASDEPIQRSAVLNANMVEGSFESIVEIPTSLSSSSTIQLLVDNGDALYYNDGTIAKELAQANHKKFRSEVFTLSAPVIETGLVSTSLCVGSSLVVPFIISNQTFNSGNVFTAQLSDASGSFGSFTVIGTLADINSGNISALIPNNTSASTNYRIRVVSSNPYFVGSDNGQNLTISAIPAQPTILPGATTICSGSTVTLTASACVGGTLNWTGGLTGSSVTVSPTSTRMYKVACTISGCTSDSSDATTVTVNQKPSKPSITPASTTICAGVSATLTASACDGGTLNWTGGLTGTSVTVSPASTRMYKVACTISGCTSDSSDATTVTVIQKPGKPSITPATTTICAGVSATLTASACDGGTLNWTGGLTGASVTVSPASTKMYKVACTISGCTSDSSDATTVTVNQKPSKPGIIPVSITICAGVSTTLTASACDGGTLNWTGGLTGASITVSPASTKMYKVACTISGCTSDSSDAIMVTVNQKPAAPIVAATPSVITVGQTSSLSATGCDGGTITWLFNNSNANPLNVSPSSTTNYTATCTLHGCVSNISNAVTVTVNSMGPCQSNVTLSSTADDYASGVQLKQASSTSGKIQATNKITGSAIVTYQAKSIELSAGFKADNGTVFKAEIGGCN